MSWEKMKPIEEDAGPCLCCGGSHSIAPLGMLIAVGFGAANVTKDGAIVYNEPPGDSPDDKFWTTHDAERAAREDPDHDWRIHLYGPLSETHYQRQGENHWVLYEQGEGFA